MTKTFFTSIVGSRMWGTHHSESDIDYFQCYIADSKDILVGKTFNRGKRSEGLDEKGMKWEKDTYEIGHVIPELIKGNANFLWGVMSPKTVFLREGNELDYWNLQQIVKKTLSKNCMFSIKGMVTNNLRKYLGVEVDRPPPSGKWKICRKSLDPRVNEGTSLYRKKINSMARTLNLGMDLLDGKGFGFEPCGARDAESIVVMLNDLHSAYVHSNLPETTDKEPFMDFLLKLRLDDLRW